MTTRAFGLLALAALLPSEAFACGGFFCNNTNPIDQSAERIAFAVDETAGTVDTHVQIFYSGTAEEFAWVLPAPSQPELFLSSDMLFQNLQWQTGPQFNLQYEEWGDCYPGWDWGWGMEDEMVLADGDLDSDGAGNSVTVVEQAQVGPYDTVVLQATNEEDLIDWLQEHNYDLPDSLSTVLAPYVAGGQYFVALRLAKDKDVGDIAPIGMTYEGTTPVIPIQLTSVAATPDMRLEVYVFGEHRAVPENYLHVQINEAAIDWLSWGSNYDDVITMAADEAGGHAFATDFSGDTTPFRNQLVPPGGYDLTAIRNAQGAVATMDAVMQTGFRGSSTLFNLLQVYMPPPTGIDPRAFYNCVSCYDTSGVTVDNAGLADAMQTFLIEPLERAEALFADHPKVTRMTSSISPVEMTVDPMFVQNADMADVSNRHEATLVTDCRGGRDWQTARRRIVLEDGRVILVPSQEWFSTTGTSTSEFFDGVTDVHAETIEATGSSGAPTLIADNRPFIDDQIDDNNSDVEDEWREGGGCSSTPSPATGLGLLPLFAMFLRRRR